MNTLCCSIANWCKKNNALLEEDYPIILYGIQILLNSSLKLSGILLIGILLKHFWTVLLSMTVFCSMRYWTGGWHSKSHLGCFCTMLIPCLVPSLLMGLDGEWVVWILSVMMLCSVYRVFRYAPCNSRINPIQDIKCLRRKRIGSIIEITGLLIVMLLCPDAEVGWLTILPTFVNAVMLTL